MQLTKKIYDLQSLKFLQNTNLNIAILGGSFNPAHSGHFLISKQALDYHKFDYVIWLIANQNPLKPKYKKDIFTRAFEALNMASHPKIIVSSVEYDLNTYYIYDSLRKIISYFPRNKFTWLMGVDNKSNFSSWYRFSDIVKLCEIIIFDRPVVDRFINNSEFDLKFKPFLAKKQTRNIMIYKGKMNMSSSSKIRHS